MSRQNLLISAAAGLACLLSVGPAWGLSINKSIHIEPGAQTGGQSSVNGSITIGSGAVVSGSVETVNGAIRIDDDVSVRSAETVNGSIRVGNNVRSEDIGSVNGSIRIGDNAAIDGEVSVVNGKIELNRGSKVRDDVSNVNGEIRIIGTEIGGDLSTVTGDVWLTDQSTLSGDLVIEKPGGWGWGRDRRKPRIVIGPGSRVLGTIVAEREIELFIHESAEVNAVTGEASLSDAVRFSGDSP